MQTLSELQDQFAVAGAIAFDQTVSGLTRISLSTGAAAAEIYLQGAHLASWTPAEQRPVLFLSAKSEFASGKAIRGGVPIVFPWFGAWSAPPSAPGVSGRWPSHGFARTLPWAVENTAVLDDGSVALAFLLLPDDTTRGLGYDRFQLRYRLTIGQTLRMELAVQNEAAEALFIEEALHSYFSISDIHSVSVSGLEGTAYVDKVAAGQRTMQPDEPIHFSGETDRVYLDTTAACVIDDRGWQRRIVIEKTGSGSTVVWNPWIDKAHSLPDFDNEEWQRMVCVETGNIAADAVAVAPGGSHVMTATVRVEAASRIEKFPVPS